MIKYIDEYRDKNLVDEIIKKIKARSRKHITIMEVCGGHTMAIQKFGIPYLLPDNIKLVSGPGCPVCVSSKQYIDKAIALCRLDNVIITTYGDLIRVPGSTSSLDKEKAAGRDIRIVYSVLDALKLAQTNPDKKVVFLGIGFETTAPGNAVAVDNAKKQNIKNFFLFSSHKIMPPAMGALIEDGVKINAYLAPGHVSTITGTSIYNFIPEKYGLSVVIAGFEPIDILLSVYMIVKQIEENRPAVEIQYRRAVRPEGNIIAKQFMDKVFTLRDDWWRGFGNIPKSGLGLNDNFKDFDAEINFDVIPEPTKEDKGCICGEILKGLKTPEECKLFKKVCTPLNPAGACMVSTEGACHAYFKYR